MAVRVRYVTDPACAVSWRAEPVHRKLTVEFGEGLSFTYVMGGLARDYSAAREHPTAGTGGNRGVYEGLLREWLDVAGATTMPIDPRLWTENPIRSTYPACMAVKAAAEQATDGGARYLRALREGLLCFRRKLDTTEALVEEARHAGLDVERFRIDLGSHAVVEAFGADLDAACEIPAEARSAGAAEQAPGGERLVFPTLSFAAEGGESQWVFGERAYEEYRDAAMAAGASPLEGGPPSVIEALQRFGRMATAEVEAVCELPRPRAAAELWQLALEWRARPLRVLTGYLWEPA